MTLLELQTLLREKYNTNLTQKLTKFGSEYVRVKGLTFRLSDHDSKWVHSNHIDVISYDSIFNYLIGNNLIKEMEISREEFRKLYVSGENYNNIKLTTTSVTLRNGDVVDAISNGYGEFVDFESAVNNLWYNLFNK